MADLTELLNEAVAMKAAKEAVAERLTEDGFAADMNTPLSEIAEMMKTDVSCLQPRLALYNTRRNTFLFVTRSEWLDMANNDNEFGYLLMLGIEVRAEGHSFIISGINIGDRTWSAGSMNVPNMTSYGPDTDDFVIDDFNGYENTLKIIEAGDNVNINTPAADEALAYKTRKAGIAQTEDPLQWYLPSAGEMYLMLKYKKLIDDEITWYRNDPKNRFVANDLVTLGDTRYWTSNQLDAGSAYAGFGNSGCVSPYYKGSTNVVRPVAAIPST